MRSILLALGVVAALAAPAFADISASATIKLLSVTGPTNSKTYTYQIDLKNTGDTQIGTFWYGWIPGYDFLTSQPTITNSPQGWFSYTTGMGPPDGGYSIQWYDYYGNTLPPGQTFQFGFSSRNSPQELSGNSPVLGYPMQTSYVYMGAAMGDPGFQFLVPAPVAVPEAGTLGVMALGGVMLMRRGKRGG